MFPRIWWITYQDFFSIEIANFQLVEKKMFCLEIVQLTSQSGKSLFTLKECAEIVSRSKGKDKCHATNGIFLHKGQGSGNCWCSTDDCLSNSSSKDINIYKLSEGKRM